ncbi:Uu.00g084940.m01.CDS01 [Anthostomella pinea]|uniref:Uu.00g084940.m01.CDS01 n=1 Tax=Anthostomella pinea TaxID=933095 RepID=A0AAI8YJW2_9PEZI|nr:Uu.00g084940.m01.CDS01 [Anthostomella pinea]
MTTLPTGGGPDGKFPVFVKKGQAVAYCVYVMHRRKDIYGEDAEKFRTERWEGDELKNIHNYAYLPFNGGPRVCLGQEFALLEASYTIVRLMQLFPKIEVPSTEPDTEIGHERQNLTLVVMATLSSGEADADADNEYGETPFVVATRKHHRDTKIVLLVEIAEAKGPGRQRM